MKWSFPSNNNGEVVGIGHPGIEFFLGTPLRSLAREICQNSLDATKNVEEPVVVEFSSFFLSSNRFPDKEGLQNAFEASLDFWSDQKSNKSSDFFKNALSTIKKDEIAFLRISDFNTEGLKGSQKKFGSAWCDLIKSSGVSDKNMTDGGSFGIGKFAPYACSSFRTVFYNTLDTENIVAFQGVSRITSFELQENDFTTGIGYLGANDNMPLAENKSLDPSFSRRSETGTDIFISGFHFPSNWETDIISSIIDGFLYAIYSGTLFVKINNIELNENTLGKIIVDYQEYLSDKSKNYYAVLTSPETVWFKDDFQGHGDIELGLIIQPEMHKRVAMIRKTGMKIKDQDYISSIIPFAGVMLIKGDKINSYLRSLENPQHTTWEPGRDVGNEKKAKKFIGDLSRYIKDCLNKLKKNDHSEEIDPSIGTYLPDIKQENDNEKNEEEALKDKIKSFSISSFKKVPRPDKVLTPGATDKKPIYPPKDKSKGKIRKGSKKKKPSYPDFINIPPSKVRVICANKQTGEYSVIFTPSISAQNGHLNFYYSAETENYKANILKATTKDRQNCSFSNNQVNNISFVANQSIKLNLTLDCFEYCALEVLAYGNKI